MQLKDLGEGNWQDLKGEETFVFESIPLRFHIKGRTLIYARAHIFYYQFSIRRRLYNMYLVTRGFSNQVPALDKIERQFGEEKAALN